jgi:hypothetical protein
MKNIVNVIVMIALLSFVVSCNNGGKQEYDGTENEQISAYSSVRTPVNLDALPKVAKDYLDKYLPDKEIVRVKSDEDDVKVWLGTGEQLKFDLDGNFKEIECLSGLPASVINERIINDVKSINPKAYIVKIDKDSNGDFDVKLDIGVEIKYDSNFNRIAVDK